MNCYLVAAVFAGLLIPRPAIAPAIAAPIGEVQTQSALMAHVREIGHTALKLGYTCREIGAPIDQCAAEYDDVFDKAMAGEPL